jgi:hypothetical protein
MSSPMSFVAWRHFAKERQRQWSSIYLVRDPQGVIFAGKLPT